MTISKVEIKIITTIKDDVGMEDVRQRILDAGVAVERVIPAIGAIFGSCDDADMTRLEAIDGVARVTLEGHVQLPPRSRDVPQ